IVELIDWPLSTHNHVAYLKMQIGAYNDVLRYARGKTEWLACVDIDEFIVPIQEKTIIETLDKHFSNCAGVVVNWQLYGTSLVEKIQPNELMVEMLTCRAPVNYQKHVSTKSIFKPHLVTECPDPHYFTYIPGHYNVDTHGQRYELLNFVIYTDVLVINHYWFKDEDFFYKVKIPRYVIWSKSNQVLHRFYDILNQEEDRIMDRFIPELRDRVFGK
ncbi:MAG TPA: glycosyltransferase family 92 protein, partial [Rhabdochlamydiaceae bacterium]